MMNQTPILMASPPSERGSPSDPHRNQQLEGVEIADKMVDRFMDQDNAFPTLVEKMRLSIGSGATLSGLQDNDYPISDPLPSVTGINHLQCRNKIPLPSEILELCCNMQQEDNLMGLFPDINRAWLAVDSDLYIWDYESGGDVAYYDGLSDMIMSVGLVKPKSLVFQSQIKRLLVLTTATEIVVLGVMLTRTADTKRPIEELHVTPEPIYTMSTDGICITVITGTDNGRIFMGGKDGSLFELDYKREVGFFGKNASKINHSKNIISTLMPTFITAAFWEEDSVSDVAVDETRHILYTLSEKGNIEVFDLGCDGMSTRRVAGMTYTSILTHASTIVNTLDPREISRLIALCPLGVSDSPDIHLSVVTGSGVRLYFSTGARHPDRPNNLSLLHVRLPPGYSANSTCFRPNLVVRALHLHGSFVIATTNKDTYQDRLWCLSSDAYPTKMWFSETVSFSNLTSPAVSLALSMPSICEKEDSFSCPQTVYQHNKRPDRIVLLTQQGTEVFEKMRPMDLLIDLMREFGGPDNEAVKNYFLLQGPDQACATALTIACNHSTTNIQMAEWATRAFFLYGGDPRTVTNANQQVAYSQFSLPPSFKPGTVSTPVGHKMNPFCSTNAVSDMLQTSAKHNGLYLNLCRILRPIWGKKVSQIVKLSDGKDYLVSNVSVEQIAKICSQLLALRTFLEKATQIPSAVPVVSSQFQDTPRGDTNVTLTGPQSRRLVIEDAVAQERKSLDSLNFLVDYSTQVLIFWRIICEHQFHVISESLTNETKAQLTTYTFRELIIAGQELCNQLINKLINLYLGDNASVDSISSKLREACPSLYKVEDAACSKANEMLQMAKDQTDVEEKQRMLRAAIKLCKEVSPHVNLSWVCKQLIANKYYDGVIELCSDAASKLDPNNLAGHYYCKNQPQDDAPGCKAYVNRLTAYKEITHMLDNVHQSNQFGSSPGSPQYVGPSNSTSLDELLVKCFDVNDEVLHVICYDWLISRSLHASLVAFGRPSLERYLSRYPLDVNLRDLLWQYHQKTGNHAQAAQILYQLAICPGDNLKLQQRIGYLAKAVMCMRSDAAGAAPRHGVFLHELEDMVQVAMVQKQVLDQITNLLASDPRAEDAVKKLNSSLLTITELFEDYAEPFGLWECKLSILDCAGHDDRELINSIWSNIISEEMQKSARSNSDDQMTLLMSKVKTLGLQYTIRSPCFPIPYLVWQLELISCRLGVNKNHVHSVLLSMGVEMATLLDVYEKMVSVNERSWAGAGNEFHLIQVIASFADCFLLNPKVVPVAERRNIAIRLQDLITNRLSTLYSKPNAKQLVVYLKTIQSKLNHI